MTRRQFNLRSFAVMIALCCGMAAMMRYAVMLSRNNDSGVEVISGILGILVVSLAAGILNRFDFVTMVVAFLSSFAIMFASICWF